MGFRIGVGKKIGGVYVGASKTIGGGSNKNNNGGCWFIGLAVIFFPITLLVLAIKKTKEQLANNPDNVWYKRSWGIIIMLIIFFPIGLYLMWKHSNWNKYIKIGVSVIIGIISIAAILGLGDDDNNTQSESSVLEDSSVVLKYEAYELSHLIDSDKDFEDSLKGKRIQISGEVKENSLTSKKIYLNGDFQNDGWFICDMQDENDAVKVEAGDLAVIEGTFENFNGHCNIASCSLISFESVTEPPTERPTEKITEAPTEKPTEKPTEELTEPIIEETEAPIDESSIVEEVFEETPVVEEDAEEIYEPEEDPDSQVIVYYTRTGECYHYENPCGRGTYYECTLSEAKSMGLRPCDKCVLH